MCAGQTGDCVPRPPPCLPLPAVAGGERCVCQLPGGTLQVCEEGEACAASCFPPAYCQDPTITATWASHNAVVTSNVKPTMVQGSELEMECLEHTFTSLSLGAGKFEQKFTAVCSDSGQWSEERCTHPLCPHLRVDSASVEVTKLEAEGGDGELDVGARPGQRDPVAQHAGDLEVSSTSSVVVCSPLTHPADALLGYR